VAVQTDGKIVVAGSSGGNFGLARYTAGGGLDTSFSDDGLQTTDFGAADGAIVIVGTQHIFNGRAGNVAVARYTPGGTLAGAWTTDFGWSQSTYDGGEGVAIQADGRIVVVGYGAEQTQFGGYYTRDLQLADTTPTARSIARSATTAGWRPASTRTRWATAWRLTVKAGS
jgi:uncharacterized delta-60 repeat protein